MHHCNHHHTHRAGLPLSIATYFFCFAAVAIPNARADVSDSRIATWFGDAAAVYTLTVDDCRPSQVDEVEPAWTSRGLVGTFFINPSDAMYYWRAYKSDYLLFPENGHELASHTMEHDSVIVNDPRYPDHCFASLEELDQDCREFEALMMDLTGRRTVSFAYPFGQDNDEARNVLAEHYLAARDVSGFKEQAGHFIPNPATPPNMYRLNTFIAAGENSWWPGHNFNEYETASSLFTQYVDDTIAAGGWGMEYSHGISEGDKIDHDAYFEHLDYVAQQVAEGVLWNATVGDAARYIYSRNAANVEILSNESDKIELAVDDGLDDALYDVPLTIVTEIPDCWTHASLLLASQEGTVRTARVFTEGEKAYASFEGLASGAPIQLIPEPAAIPAPTAIPEPTTFIIWSLLGGLSIVVTTWRRG